MNCLTAAWSQHQHELRNRSRHKLRNQEDVDDFLQDLFLKVLRRGEPNKTVVVTHHAPLVQSVPEEFVGDILSPA